MDCRLRIPLIRPWSVPCAAVAATAIRGFCWGDMMRTTRAGRILKAARTLIRAMAAAAILAAPVTATAQAGILNAATRWYLTEENDGMITHDDRHYTQGLRFSALLPGVAEGGLEDKAFDTIGAVLPMYRNAPGVQRRLEWIALGQSIFTPSDSKKNPPDPTDRPYAGWLYTGFSILQENDGHSLHSLELLGGVVGSWSLAHQTQETFHHAAAFGQAYGWDYQLGNRGALQLSYEYRRRFGLHFQDGYGVDLVPEVGLSMGSVMRYLDAGALLRFGNTLGADYGPVHVRPALSGTAYFDERAVVPRHFHYYVFAGAQTRWTFYNRFIDGGAELGAPLDRTDAVTDLLAGVSFLIGHTARADFTATRRDREFATQHGDDVFGSATLAIVF
jgi:hypothetical protein